MRPHGWRRHRSTWRLITKFWKNFFYSYKMLHAILLSVFPSPSLKLRTNSEKGRVDNLQVYFQRFPQSPETIWAKLQVKTTHPLSPKVDIIYILFTYRLVWRGCLKWTQTTLESSVLFHHSRLSLVKEGKQLCTSWRHDHTFVLLCYAS